MTIRLTDHATPHHLGTKPDRVVTEGGSVLAYAGTKAEAEKAKRAFEQVLLPRFTREEAIAIVLAQDFNTLKARAACIQDERARRNYESGYTDATRNILRVLAAAGVFSDGTYTSDRLSRLELADLERADMADLLDAAGIR